MKPKPQHLFVDQYGQRVYACTAKELAEKCGHVKTARMYRDKKDGTTVHCGYVVADRWFTRYVPWEVKV